MARLEKAGPGNAGAWTLLGLVVTALSVLASGGLTLALAIHLRKELPAAWVPPVITFFIVLMSHHGRMADEKALEGQDLLGLVVEAATTGLLVTVGWYALGLLLATVSPGSSLGEVACQAVAVLLLVGLVAAIARVLFGPVAESKKTGSVRVLRGVNLERVETKSQALAGYRPGYTFFGGRWLKPPQFHVVAVGQTRAGKTLTLLMYLRSAIAVGGKLRARAIIYDAKGNMIQRLLSWGIKIDQITIFEPWHSLGRAWDIASDSVGAEIEVAEILCQQVNTSEGRFGGFFGRGSTLFLAALMSYMNLAAPGQWVLLDLIIVLQQPHHVLRHMLERSPLGKLVHPNIVDLKRIDEQGHGILGTSVVNLGHLLEVAHLWKRTEKRFSIAPFLASKQPMVLLIRADLSQSETFMPLVRALFRRTAMLISERPDTQTDPTYFFLDELRNMGPLEGLPTLLTKAPSKGARVLMGLHSIVSLRVVYKVNEADEIISQASLLAFLRNDDVATQQYASDALGTFEGVRSEMSYSTGSSGGKSNYSSSLTERVADVRAVLPQEVGQLPLANPVEGLSAFFKAPGFAPWFTTLPPDLVTKAAGAETPAKPESRRPMQDSAPVPWTPDDFDRLQIPFEEGEQPSSPLQIPASLRHPPRKVGERGLRSLRD